MPTEHGSPVSRRKLGIFGIVAGGAAVLIVITGIRAREDSSAKLREWTDTQAIPTVAVILPDARVLNATLDLPGRLEAYQRAPIYARVSGYLKSWNADIGAQVKAGQAIAEIEAPDLEAEFAPAQTQPPHPAGQSQTVESDPAPPQVAAGLEFRLDAGDRRA